MDKFISVKKLSESDFLNFKNEWNELLINSNSNNFFLSWEWMSNWWNIWRSKIFKAEILVLAVYENNQLIGIAPFYKDVRVFKKTLPVKRVQFLGTAYQSISTVRTEYLSIIFRKGFAEKVYQNIEKYLLSCVEWDEIVFKDIVEKELFYNEFFLSFKRNGTVRIIGYDIGYSINTCNIEFVDFLHELGKNTRLKLFNRRVRLGEIGLVEIEYYGFESKHDMLNLLNTFHIKRWGRDCFSQDSLKFHYDLIDALNLLDCFSVLKVSGRPVSILYNVRVDDVVYNLQSGYLENIYPGVSLGTLHLGYEFERCFNDKSIEYFDLLAGFGKNIDYKKRFNGQSTQFLSMHIIRTKWLGFLYRIKDFYRTNEYEIRTY